jgi:hypothetical protein
MAWRESNQVIVVLKNMHPPNCPELRPIEQYWAIVKRIMKKSGLAVHNVPAITKKWNQCAAKVTNGLVQKLMATISKRTRLFFRA